jgi:uncharacterized spore protein YtfJ
MRTGVGAGGGVMVTPIAFIVMKGDEISFHGVKRGGALDGFFEQLPEITDKILAKCHAEEVKGEQAEPEG